MLSLSRVAFVTKNLGLTWTKTLSRPCSTAYQYKLFVCKIHFLTYWVNSGLLSLVIEILGVYNCIYIFSQKDGDISSPVVYWCHKKPAPAIYISVFRITAEYRYILMVRMVRMVRMIRIRIIPHVTRCPPEWRRGWRCSCTWPLTLLRGWRGLSKCWGYCLAWLLKH